MKKYYGCKWLFIVISIIVLIDYFLFIFTIIYTDLFENSLWVIVLFIFFIGIFPLFLFLYSYKIMFSTIIINEKGIYKKRFNKTKLFISWEELVDIKFYNPNYSWIVFSKEPIKNLGFSTITIFKKVICLVYVNEIGIDVLKYCHNEKIRTKIQNKSFGRM